MDDKPPSVQTSKRVGSLVGSGRTDIGHLHWLPVWKSANLQGLAIHSCIGGGGIYQYKGLDLGTGKND